MTETQTPIGSTKPQPDLQPDSDWPSRCHRRLQAALEFLGEQSEPRALIEVEKAACDRVPLTEYDASQTSPGSQRGLTNLRWLLSTGCQHAGWAHNASAGYRITRQGREMLAQGLTGDEMYELMSSKYSEWDSSRKEILAAESGDPAVQIVQPGAGVGHTLRATGRILDAWRRGDSHFAPDVQAWGPAATQSLLSYLQAAPSPIRADLPALTDDAARLLASEAMALLQVSLIDIAGSDKRSWVKSPLSWMVDPPGIPLELSADLEHGFVRSGRAFAANAIALLTSFTRLLDHWWTLSDQDRAAAWDGPWVWRDTFAGVPNVPSSRSLVARLST